MNGWTPAIAIFLLTIVFGAGGVYVITQDTVSETQLEAVEDKVEALEKEDVVLHPEFDAVVERIEQGQQTLKEDVGEIKGDVKEIERMIRRQYGDSN